MTSSTHRASHHFIMQRVSGVALIPLVIWFCFSLASLPEASYSTALEWVKTPINTILLLLLVIVSFRHAILGLQVILEDYISNIEKRNSLIFIIKLLSYFLMIASILSILKIIFGG